MYFEYHKQQQQQLAEIKARMVRDAQVRCSVWRSARS
jgi:hypothetical protein